MADFSFFSERRQSLVTQLLLAIPRTDWFLVVPALKQKKSLKVPINRILTYLLRRSG
jgi:hypothetical protein